MSATHGHSPGEDLGPARTIEVADGVFAYVQPDGSWWINNTGFVVGPDRVVAVDATSTERRTRALLEAISVVSPQPVTTLVNTHHHGDHTNGNCLFESATVVGHENCRANMAGQAVGGLDAIFGPVEWGDLEVVAPQVTFAQRCDLWLADRRVELHYAGTPAHTTGDIYAWLPEEKILFAGDLVFNGGTPFVLMGSVSGSLEVIGRLEGLGAATIVPGHGKVCGPDVLSEVAAYLHFVSDLATQARAAGETPLDAARQADLGDFARLTDGERLAGNLHRAYAELDGAPRGAPVDLMAAFGDMIALNGGAPLRCLA